MTGCPKCGNVTAKCECKSTHSHRMVAGYPRETKPRGMAVPDRIAIDAAGYGWRVWDDQDYWSMVPINSDNSPIPKPVTWFVPAVTKQEADLRAVTAAVTVNGYERLMEMVGDENHDEALACLLGVARAVARDFAYEEGHE